MHIDIVPNRKSRPAYLLRESYREGTKVRKRTLANLSSLSDAQLMAIRAVLQGHALVPAAVPFEVSSSRAHGHVEAIRVAMSRLGMSALLGGRPCAERDRVLAMIAARVLAPHTKLATTRWWHTTTLAEDFGVADATEADLYAAMDWLIARQDAIQAKLAARHLAEESLVLYDLSSSYFEGSTCPLAKLGYNRDGKAGKLQVNYGLMTDSRGCPLAVSVYDGNVADPVTLMPEVDRLRKNFGIEQFVLVGDRGMISQKAIDELQQHDGIGWITALRSVSIRALVEQGQIQLGLFDERNLFAFSHPDYPSERLVACRNPELARRRAYKREDLLQATEKNLSRVLASVEAGRLQGRDQIGLRVGRVLHQYKVAKHFELDIHDTVFRFKRREEAIAAEAALDGIYVIRTSVSAERMDSAACVRHYKSLAQVERAFRTMKSMDLKIRPIHHRLEERVRAHIFLCMLAYYVEWHLRQAWSPLMFTDEDPEAKATRDPVAPAQRSPAAKQKVTAKMLDDETPVHSFATLIADLGSIVRNTCHAPNAKPGDPTFAVTTNPSPQQKRALDLLQTIQL